MWPKVTFPESKSRGNDAHHALEAQIFDFTPKVNTNGVKK